MAGLLNDPIARYFRFLTTRLLSIAGYYSLPSTYDALPYLLPPFDRVHGRCVEIGEQMWELWSPNSSIVAFYPGLRDPPATFGAEIPPESRRSDGHLGRFDYTVSPQHYDSNRPWLGFIRRQTPDSRAENAAFLSVWFPTSANQGRFKPKFVTAAKERIVALLNTRDDFRHLEHSNSAIWETRPQDLNIFRLTPFQSDMILDDAIDRFAAIQRDMKEMSAWNRFANCVWLESLPAYRRPTGNVPRADESLMGVWINGCEEADALFLLRNRVPCFIVHKGEGREERRDIASRYRRYTSMVADTSIALLEPRHNLIEKRLKADGQELRDLRNDTGLAPPHLIPRHMQADRKRSSPNAQGWRNGVYCNPKVLPTVTGQSGNSSIVTENGKVVPPPVTAAANTGKWSHWWQDWDTKEPNCLIKRGKGPADHPEEATYYDRSKKRYLYLSDELDTPDNYDAPPDVFGLPLPELTFLESVNNQGYRKCSSSTWVYVKELPRKSDVGRVFLPPPIVDDTRANPDSEDEDVVSLGNDEDDRGVSEVIREEDSKSVNPVDSSSAAKHRSPHAPLVTGIATATEEPRRSAFVGAGRPNAPRWLPSQLTEADRHYRPPASSGRYVSQTERYFQRNSALRPPPRFQDDPPKYQPIAEERPPNYRENALVRRVASRSRSRSPKRHHGEIDDVNDEEPRLPIVVAPMTRERVNELFPVPTSSPITRLAPMRDRTPFVIIWNIPNIFRWDDILDWIQKTLPLAYDARLDKLMRTCERGLQVFWLVFKTSKEAATFRGIAENRVTDNGHTARCDFVSFKEYTSACGHCRDVWFWGQGHKNGLSGSDAFPAAAPKPTSASLAERLGMQVNGPGPSRRTRRGNRGGKNRKQDGPDASAPDPADGGAL